MEMRFLKSLLGHGIRGIVVLLGLVVGAEIGQGCHLVRRRDGGLKKVQKNTPFRCLARVFKRVRHQAYTKAGDFSAYFAGLSNDHISVG